MHEESGRLMRRTTDQNAGHKLMLACRRLDRAIASPDPMCGEGARGAVVKGMAALLEEFGLLEAAQKVRDALPEFDGRHIE